MLCGRRRKGAHHYEAQTTGRAGIIIMLPRSRLGIVVGKGVTPHQCGSELREVDGAWGTGSTADVLEGKQREP